MARYAEFLAQYQRVRADEGWGGMSAAYYQRLPEVDVTDRQHAIWSLRQQHYQAFIHRILMPLEQKQPGPLAILDVGAGNGWLSNQLSARGHHVAAIDINTDIRDGLGAHVNYECRFLSIQAEFERLPFIAGQADLVVFNGAFHYAPDDRTVLSEALRVLKPSGQIILMDSPCYSDPASGAAMLHEHEQAVLHRYGFAMHAPTGVGYLTWQRLDELVAGLGCARRITWTVPAWRRSLRRARARLRMKREAAQFPLLQVLPYAAWQIPLARRLLRRVWEPYLRWSYRWMHRLRAMKARTVRTQGLSIEVSPGVFDPALFRSGVIFAQQMNAQLIPAGSTVLDMGTGTGIGAIRAAQWARRVVAVDINPAAVRCATANVVRNHMEDCVQVREGDLFLPLRGERFEVVLFNPPYFHGVPANEFEQAFFSPHVNIAERFAVGLASHLTDKGYALLLLSSRGEQAAFLQALRWQGFGVHPVATHDWNAERFTLYRAFRTPPAQEPQREGFV
jgi:methylase of polypeptide subunit release factors